MARKILLADDSVTAQNMGRKILTDAGYDVITVNNGSAALKRVAEQKPDLIVLDVYMPGYSGLEVCVRLKDSQETARIPILLTVGKLEPFKPEEATRVHADGFIVKPFEASELLSALTRLEDRMVPSQGEGGRFSGNPAIERFSGGDPSVNRSQGTDDSDTGWKNRLRFPSKKKKEEAEPEPEPDFVTPSNFRDFRRGGGKSPAGTSFPAATAANPGPSVIPDIPRDITPEELDALSEVAAKLDKAPTAEKEAPVAEAIVAVASAPQPQSETHAPAPVADTPQTEAVTVPAQVKAESEVPAATINSEAAVTESVETRFSAPSVDAPPPEVKVTSVDSPPEPLIYQTEAAVAKEPAPIDREDEPRFAGTANEAAEAKPEVGLVTVPQASAGNESLPEESRAEAVAHYAGPKAEYASPAEFAATLPSAAATAPESQSPSSEELAEALRFLTPSQATSTPQTLAEAGAALANELARGANGRWVAESVPLSPEEASGSLEAEMFRTFAPSLNERSVDSGASPVAASLTELPAVVSEAPVESSTATASPVQENSALKTAEFVAIAEPGVTTRQNLAGTPAPEDLPEEPAATTFADAISNQEEETGSAVAEATEAAETLTHQPVVSSENGPGGEESMAKENTGKGGKSNWHQIRSGAPVASGDAVEAATQSEDAPKTMAAAAATDGASDASSIASIVDSVLADLRPKIVEEIARQLAKK